MTDERTTQDEVWKHRFRAPVIAWTSIARRAPERGLVATNRSGTYQLYAWDVASGDLVQVTDEPEGRIWGTLSPDGRYLYYLDDEHGNEIGHYARIPLDGGAKEDVTPDMPPYSSFSFGISGSANRLGFTTAGQDGFTVYAFALGPDGSLGPAKTLYTSKRLSFGPDLSYDGSIAVVTTPEHTEKLQFSLIAFDTTSSERLSDLWDGPDTSVEAGPFAPVAGDDRLVASTDRSGVKRPFIWNARTGERVDLALEDVEGEVTAWGWSWDAALLLLCQFSGAVQQLYVYDVANRSVRRLDHPSGTFGGAYFTPDGTIFAQWTDAAHPSQLIALDPASGEQTRVVLAAGEVPPGRPWCSVTFPSTDGQLIQGWLGVPAGTGPFPLMLETHGGPTAVQPETFDPRSQAWLDRGFAFLTINYRGSTTFGKAFEEQIWGDLGHWEVEDMVAARAWAVSEGIARPDEVFLTGWSYGGYLTLQALGTYPELWAGGLAGIAIADWTMNYEDSADTLRGYQVGIFGGTPEEKPELYARSSPMTYIEQVKAPVLIIQGRNDTRTPSRPIEVYVERMRALGKPIEIHWFEAGHQGPFAQMELGIRHQELMLRFADQVLDG